PATVFSSTIKTALVAARKGAVTGVVSTKVAVLMEGVMKTMLLTKLKMVATVLLVLGMVAFDGVEQDDLHDILPDNVIPIGCDIFSTFAFSSRYLRAIGAARPGTICGTAEVCDVDARCRRHDNHRTP